MRYMKAAVIMAGVMFSFLVGTLVLSAGLGSVVSRNTESIIAYNVVFVTMGIVSVIFQEPKVLVAGFSLIGAMAAFLGLDVLIRGGFLEVITAAIIGVSLVVIEEEDATIEAIAKGTVPLQEVPRFVWLFLASVVLTATFGAVVQTRPNKASPPRPKPAPSPSPPVTWWSASSRQELPQAPPAPPKEKAPVSWWKGDVGTGWDPKY
ncbi:MAG: hypothetical protein SGCHY_002265 [Lobulomycetales sp.]